MTIKFNYELYPHQQRAYEKLRSLKVGALYMEMGTGKTRTMLEIIKDKYDKGKIDKVIWVCPCSAKENIRRDLIKHLKSGHEIFMIVGIESMSSSVKLNSFMRQYVEDYRCLIVVDESSKIKNYSTKRTINITEIGKKCDYRFILNGTPISRDEKDLFSQWYFLDWRILGYQSYWSFEKNHVVFHEEYKNKVVGTMNTEYLARKIAPYTYQVSLQECVELPPKLYEERHFELTDEQSDMYDEIAEFLLSQVDEWNPSTIYKLFSTLQAITSGFVFSKGKKKGEVEKKAYLGTVDLNPRLKCFSDLIETTQGKIIIYCEYTVEVETILKLLNGQYGKDSAVGFYGEMSLKKRNESIRKFEEESRFFVANKDCAGYSLNLQFCHQVIYYNNDWDFGTRLQSEDRIHRIGQKEKSCYIDLIASGTIEEVIIECLMRKEKLSDRFKSEVENSKDKKAAELMIMRKKQKGNKMKYKHVRTEEVPIEMVGDLCENI